MGLSIRFLTAFGLALALAPQAHADVPGRLPGDPKVNIAGLPQGVRYGSITNGKPVTPVVLFGKDGRPEGKQIRQRIDGDCYLEATAAAYAEFHPKVIQGIYLTKEGALRTSPGGASPPCSASSRGA